MDRRMGEAAYLHILLFTLKVLLAIACYSTCNIQHGTVYLNLLNMHSCNRLYLSRSDVDSLGDRQFSQIEIYTPVCV